MMVKKKEEIIICGLNAVVAEIKNRPQEIVKLFYLKEKLDFLRPYLKTLAKEGIAYEAVDLLKIETLSKSTHHEGISLITNIDRPLSWGEFEKDHKNKQSTKLLYLGEIKNPHNLGAILRSAVHFGFFDIVVGEESGINSSACYRTSEGGRSQIRLIKSSWDEMYQYALLKKINVIATAIHKGENLYKINLPKHFVLVFGEEKEGLPKDKISASHNIINIPGTSMVESLNVSCAATAIFAEFYRKINNF